MARQIKKADTDQSVVIRIVDSTDGTPEEGVVAATAGLNLWYRREGAAVVNLTESDLGSVGAAHTDGGMIHLDDGYYRVDLPDAAFATGANHVCWGGTATGMVVIGGEVQLIGLDLEDAVRGGMTALPDAAADAAGGLPISDAGGLDLDTFLAFLDVAVSSISAAVWDKLRASHRAAGSFGQLAQEKALAAAFEHTAAKFVAASSMYAEAADDPDFDVGTQDFILTYWIKTTDDDCPIIYKNEGGASGVNLHWSSYLSADGYAVGHAGDGTDLCGPLNDIIPVNDGVPHFVACVFDKSDRAWVVVDGVPDHVQDDDCSDIGDVDNDHVVRMGRYDTYYFDGELLDVRLYRCGVDGLPTNIDDALRSMYRGGPGFHAPELAGEDLTLHFLPGNLGDFTDQSGNGNDLTPYNSPTFVGMEILRLPWNIAWNAEVQSEATDALNAYDPPTKAELDTGLAAVIADTEDLQTQIGTAGAGLADLGGMSTGMKAEVQTEANDALVANHLDHLLAVDYDPASKPGVATALFNEIFENDGGVSRFTENALEQAPGAATTIYFVTGDSNQKTNGDLRWSARCYKNGVIQTAATNCIVQLLKEDGDGTITEVAGATETVANPDANGVFNGTLAGLTLDPGIVYYMLATITVDAVGRIGVFEVKVPVRTA